GKRWQRALVLIAGPAMNLVLALLLHTAVFAIGVRVPAYELSPAVIGVVEPGSPAAQAGVQPGDRIISIDGSPTPRQRAARFVPGMSPRQKLEVELERRGQRRIVTFTPKAVGKYDIGDAGIYPEFGRNLRGKVGVVVSGSPAAAAAFTRGVVI